MNDDPNNSQMNPWIEPELEARIVAWVAGEASPFEIAELERLVAEKPELAVFKRRIEAVHGLMGQAVRPDPTPLRMSEERRAKLLAALGAKSEAPALGERVATVTSIDARPKWWRQPQLYFALSGVAAACFIGV